jgi:hypothetical protein
MRRFHEGDLIQKAATAEVLSAILFQSCDINRAVDQPRIHLIAEALIGSRYEYVLKDYLKVYYYQGLTEEGRQFLSTLTNEGFQA